MPECEEAYTNREEKEETEMKVPNNYCLEVEQFVRCIKNGEVPYLTEKFSVDMADTVDEILKQIGY